MKWTNIERKRPKIENTRKKYRKEKCRMNYRRKKKKSGKKNIDKIRSNLFLLCTMTKLFLAHSPPEKFGCPPEK